jgi:hypothetical protein
MPILPFSDDDKHVGRTTNVFACISLSRDSLHSLGTDKEIAYPSGFAFSATSWSFLILLGRSLPDNFANIEKN